MGRLRLHGLDFRLAQRFGGVFHRIFVRAATQNAAR
jgi:hypothetical protein